MKKLRIAICDDEAAARDIVSGAVRSILVQRKVEPDILLFTSASRLRDEIGSSTFDLLILDIDMPGLSGIELGKILRGEENMTDIIFVSNREDKVFEALKVEPVGFVRKSRLIEDIPDVLNRYITRKSTERREAVFTVDARDRLYTVPTSSIIYFEGSRNCQLMHVSGENEVVQIRRSMQELESELTAEGFIRVHKGFLVNYRFIRVIELDGVLLTDNGSVPLSRRKFNEVKSQFMKLLREND